MFDTIVKIPSHDDKTIAGVRNKNVLLLGSRRSGFPPHWSRQLMSVNSDSEITFVGSETLMY